MAKRNMDIVMLARQIGKLPAAQMNRLLQMAKSAPKLEKLDAQRAKLLAQLEAVDRQIAEIGGEQPAKPARKTTRKPGRKAAAAKKAVAAPRAAKGAKKAVKAVKTAKRAKAAGIVKSGRGGRRQPGGLMDSLVKVMVAEGRPMNRREIVDALPGVGYKVVKDSATLKAVSQLFLTRKDDFEKIDRGLYRLSDSVTIN